MKHRIAVQYVYCIFISELILVDRAGPRRRGAICARAYEFLLSIHGCDAVQAVSKPPFPCIRRPSSMSSDGNGCMRVFSNSWHGLLGAFWERFGSSLRVHFVMQGTVQAVNAWGIGAHRTNRTRTSLSGGTTISLKFIVSSSSSHPPCSTFVCSGSSCWLVN